MTDSCVTGVCSTGDHLQCSKQYELQTGDKVRCQCQCHFRYKGGGRPGPQ